MENLSNAAVIGRMVLKGYVVLKSPLLIGDGTGDESYDSTKDIHVLKNKQQQPFIPGTSLAGVMREYVISNKDNDALMLFGNADDEQSLLQVSDIKLVNAQIVSRDGVRIDSYTGTAADGAKFDYEVVDRGAKGELNLSIVLRQKHRDKIADIRKAFVKLRTRLEEGIAVGGKTATGFGRIKLEQAKSGYYDFSNQEDVRSWLLDYKNIPNNAKDKIAEKCEVDIVEENRLVVDALFAIRSAMLIRDMDVSGDDKDAKISAVFKKSGDDFVIPGTSMKGVLRHHAEYVLSRLNFSEKAANKYINELMGHSTSNKDKAKSRFYVDEVYIKPNGVKEYAQARTRIDRITGGVVRSALFSTQPIWQKDATTPTVHVHFEIKNASEADAGMAMLLLRDMWLGNVAIGGEKSIGRGTLQGISATVHYIDDYELGEKGKLLHGNKEQLEEYTRALKNRANLLAVMEEEA